MLLPACFILPPPTLWRIDGDGPEGSVVSAGICRPTGTRGLSRGCGSFCASFEGVPRSSKDNDDTEDTAEDAEEPELEPVQADEIDEELEELGDEGEEGLERKLEEESMGNIFDIRDAIAEEENMRTEHNGGA